MGYKQTMHRLQQRYTWPGMTQDVRRYCRGCLACQQAKPQTTKRFGLLVQMPLGGPGEVLGIDLMGPFPMSKSRNIFLLVSVDQFSKWPELFPLHSSKTVVVRDRVLEVCCRQGFPVASSPIMAINSWRASGTVSGSTWGSRQNSLLLTIRPANYTEWVNGTLKTMLKTFTESHNDLDDRLQ